MTWLKLSDDYAAECERARLSDAAFRCHTEALLEVMRLETGGALDRTSIRRAITIADPDTAITELVSKRFWAETGPGQWTIVHHMIHQAEPDVLAARRQATAERARKYRRKLAKIPGPPGPGSQTGNGVTSRVTSRVTLVGSGLVGTGNPNPHQREQIQDTDQAGNTSGPEIPCCRICGEPLDRELAELGYLTHASCEPDP